MEQLLLQLFLHKLAWSTHSNFQSLAFHIYKMEMIKLSYSHTDSEKVKCHRGSRLFSDPTYQSSQNVCVGHLHANQMEEKTIKGSCKCHIHANLNSPVQLEQEKGLCQILGLFGSICLFL